MKKVFIVGGGYDYEQLFERLGYEAVGAAIMPDLVCFTGGSDVSPGVYGDKPHPQTYSDAYRDQKEAQIMLSYVEKGVPLVGICRGGQFLNCMSGGRMYQHVDKHCRSHSITDARTGEQVFVSSTHHQMMMPSPEALLVASSTLGGSREWFDGEVFKRDVSEEDIEVVYYENTKALCFQPHPEFQSAEYGGMEKYFAGLLKEFFNL